MTRKTIWASMPLGLALCATPLAAQRPLTSQEPASAQPTLPKPMPDLTVPSSGSIEASSKKHSARTATRHVARHRRYAETRGHAEPENRLALANVELLEPLPHPPQPPHVTVPVPAYPLENFVTYYTAPPPPVVCQPTRYDRYKPDLHLLGEKPVLCTGDNP